MIWSYQKIILGVDPGGETSDSILQSRATITATSSSSKIDKIDPINLPIAATPDSSEEDGGTSSESGGDNQVRVFQALHREQESVSGGVGRAPRKSITMEGLLGGGASPMPDNPSHNVPYPRLCGATFSHTGTY